MKKITFVQLPIRAQRSISQRQQSYIDEFTFYQAEDHIQAFYAGELLCVFRDNGWQLPIQSKGSKQ
jgi:hypothetical protein